MTFSDVFVFFNTILPSLTFLNENFLLQFFLWYVLILLLFSNSLFYSAFYLFIEVVLIGVFLSLYQLDLLMAFLWLTECIVIFVSLLLLFYVAVYDVANGVKIAVLNNKNLIFFLTLFFLSLLCTPNSELEFYLPTLFSHNQLWENYYEALWNDKVNDLFGVFLSFYTFNSFEFAVIGYLLLIGSVICVNLNRFLKTNKTYNYKNLFELFDIFKDNVKMFFLRKQNLVNQAVQSASTRVFGRKY